jgi:signal peptidase II
MLMMRASRLALLLMIMCGCVGCDQVTKLIVRDRLPFERPISLLHDTVRLHYTRNTGSFLGLGQSLPEGERRLTFTVGGAILVTLAIFWTLRTRSLGSLQAIGAATACGGGLGNMIDRLTLAGNVTDFLNIGVGPVRTGIFNVADMALMLGVTLVVLGHSRSRPSALTVTPD